MANPAIPKTMKGLQITEFKKPYKLSNGIPVPQINRDNEVLIKVAVAGYCHTEMMVQNGEFESKMHGGNTLPLVPSHEGTGVIVAVGSRVSNVKVPHCAQLVQVGDRVATLCIRNPCGKCSDCKQGIPKYCEGADMSGVISNGAGAEYMIADSNYTIPLPSNLDFDSAAPLMCAGATIYCGLKTADLKPGQTVAIIGAGALGHLGIQFAKCMGLRVVSVDSRQAPLDLVKSLKYAPDYAIDAMKGVDFALQEIGGEGVDATLMATDAIPAHEYGLMLTRKHGTFVVIGQPFDPIPIHYNHLIFRNLTIKGSLLSDAQMAKEMVDLVAEKGIEVKTRSYPLEEIETLVREYHAENHCGKLVLRISQDV
ncbi:GroES-like protein [Ramaria rubella]|nr:GroES-like protein [Ramaria rubella]